MLAHMRPCKALIPTLIAADASMDAAPPRVRASPSACGPLFGSHLEVSMAQRAVRALFCCFKRTFAPSARRCRYRAPVSSRGVHCLSAQHACAVPAFDALLARCSPLQALCAWTCSRATSWSQAASPPTPFMTRRWLPSRTTRACTTRCVGCYGCVVWQLPPVSMIRARASLSEARSRSGQDGPSCNSSSCRCMCFVL